MLTVRVSIANPDALLTAWGAGARARLESSATETGSYAEVGTAALLSGLFEYYIVDPAGTAALWYRWRPSTAAPAAPADYGAYSDPWVAGGPYLTVDQFRAFNAADSLTDESLLILLDAAAQAIIREHGPSGAITERLRAGGDLLMLSRPALSITLVVEDARLSALSLSADDYELSGQTLYRLSDGTNPGYCWRGRVDVTYVPFDDTAERQRVQRELVQLDLTFQPGLASQRIGEWTESYSADKPYAEQRAAIVGQRRARMDIDPVVAVDVDQWAAIVDQQGDRGTLLHSAGAPYSCTSDLARQCVQLMGSSILANG